MSNLTFTPGEIVPCSGIYKVIHDADHGAAHEVTAVQGERFPPCRLCGRHPQFILIQAADYVHFHDFFREGE